MQGCPGGFWAIGGNGQNSGICWNGNISSLLKLKCIKNVVLSDHFLQKKTLNEIMAPSMMNVERFAHVCLLLTV